MKKCTWCGNEQSDEAEKRSIDQQSLVTQELERTHHRPNSRVKGKKSGPAMLSLIWLVLVGLFTAEGFLSPGIYSANQAAVQTGALGVGVATIVVVGLCVVTRVRAHNLGRGFGVLLIAVASVLAAVLPPIIMDRSGFYSSGEASSVPGFALLITMAGGVLAFVVLTLCVLLVPRKEK